MTAKEVDLPDNSRCVFLCHNHHIATANSHYQHCGILDRTKRMGEWENEGMRECGIGRMGG